MRPLARHRWCKLARARFHTAMKSPTRPTEGAGSDRRHGARRAGTLPARHRRYRTRAGAGSYPESDRLPGQTSARGRAWSAFTHKRKHKAFKQFASAVTNTETFERTVTVALLNHQVNCFNDPDARLFCVGPYLLAPVYLVDGTEFGPWFRC